MKRTINTREIRDLDETRYLLYSGEIVERKDIFVTYETDSRPELNLDE